MPAFRFPHPTLPPEIERLREEVRAFLAHEMKAVPAAVRAQSWMGFDRAFTRKVAERGWIGMTWPRRYGGAGRSHVERHIVIEEMLAEGAPLGAHFIADRQSGPLILRYGSEAQRTEYLPRIARGELAFCIGMSEPEAGSDLAAIRARAVRAGRGFVLNGTKLWTSLGQEADMMIGLFRTAPAAGEDRHQGFTQFLIDLDLPGISIRPIDSLMGAHFAQVHFADVHVPEEALIGQEGEGWTQVMSELALERAGPERVLSAFPLLAALAREIGPKPGAREAVAMGEALAELFALRGLSLSLAALLDEGREPAAEGALVKDLGTAFEQRIPVLAESLRPLAHAAPAGDYAALLRALLLAAPAFSLRGGTREILRTVIARTLLAR